MKRLRTLVVLGTVLAGGVTAVVTAPRRASACYDDGNLCYAASDCIVDGGGFFKEDNGWCSDPAEIGLGVCDTDWTFCWGEE